MKLTLLEVGKKFVFSQFFENTSNGIDVKLIWIFGMDKNIIYINNDNNIELLGQDLINVILEVGRCVGELKKYYLVLEIVISSFKARFLFIALFYLYPMVNICEIELGKLFGLT